MEKINGMLMNLMRTEGFFMNMPKEETNLPCDLTGGGLLQHKPYQLT